MAALHDPGLHLFVDDDEVQDHPGFARRDYRMGFYQERAGQVPHKADPEGRAAYFDSIRDRHGVYTAESADGLHWVPSERPAVTLAGDAGAFGWDPISGRYLVTSRRRGTLSDHFVLQWKRYRRVIALSTSADFVHWIPLETVLKLEDFDDPGDPLYAMPRSPTTTSTSGSCAATTPTPSCAPSSWRRPATCTSGGGSAAGRTPARPTGRTAPRPGRGPRSAWRPCGATASPPCAAAAAGAT